MSTQAFRFLDLPAELRCMVYEAIEMTTRKEELDVTKWGSKLPDKSLTVMLRGALQMSILATCRLVNQEASPIMACKIQTMSNEPMRFLMDWDVAVAARGLLYLCFDTSPKAVSAITRVGGPGARFIRSCRSYYVATAGTRTLATCIPNMEFTITALTAEFGTLDTFHVMRSFYNIYHGFGISLDVFWNKSFLNSAFHMRVRQSESPEFDFRDLTDAEWAEHARKLGDL